MWLVDPTQPKVGTPPLDNNIIVEQTSKEDVYNKMNQLLLQHTYDPSKTYMGLYWGGDIEGIIKKLDYLKDLGVTKIIISPIQDNANGILYNPKFHNYLYRTHQEKGLKNNLYTHVFSPYHGYWIKDWFEIDEHFRNPNDGIGNDRFQVLRRLLNEAGKRGIGVIMDLTLNHTSPSHFSNIPFVFNPNSPAAMFVDDGSIYREGKLVASYWNRQLGSIDPKGKKWFHPPKQIDFNRPNAKMLEQGMLEGLPDLNQDVPEVEKYLLDAVRFWLTFNNGSTQIVGFRLDSIKHVNLRFWQKLEKFILDINPSAILIGEYFSGGYRNPESISFLKKTNNITQFDFDLSNSARRFFAGDRAWDGRTYMLEETILGRKGNYYNYSFVRRIFHWLLNPAATLEISRKSLDSISDTDAKSWVTFSENHDLPRLKTRYINMSDSAYASLIKFQFVARGVPMIMYGMETGLAVPYHPKHKGLFGIGGDPFNRPMMIWSNSLGWKNSLYQTTKKMAHLRQKYPVLRYGDTRFLHPNKFHRDQDIFMLREYEKCNKNNNSICKSILYAYSTRGGEFKLKSPAPGISQYEVTETGEKKSIINGEIHIQLRAEEALVLILN
ncbi:cyclomaltodextrin glucanotransferase [Nostoc parmelioides FACHB-3921]|uniref:Cyclomaltodextrin glucanotransferase n=2 Tax=Nostoc TaxID=1177 RepID=A0ABR8BEN6_9NOSO|nr:cyclomaltodextrin glucanotransferase [Nostoc parmelioides FACHB-3921]